MKRILVPCDFSPPSIQAFKFASEIARAGKGEVFLLHIMEVPVLHNSLFSPVRAYENAFLKSLKEKATKNFEKMKDKWGKKVKVQLFFVQGPVISTINRFVDRKRIDLVIMGTHGSSGIREYAVGSNTEKMVRTSKVPVVAVKKAPKTASFKDLVFPTSLDAEKKLVASVKALQKFFKAKLHILYVNTPANFSRDILTMNRLDEFGRRNQFKNYTVNIFNDQDEEDGIIHFSSRYKSKLIAMATHARKGLGHLLGGSVAEDVVNHIDCPIWTSAEK